MSLNDYIYKKPLLSTRRLVLRELAAPDADDLREWTADESLYKYWGKRPGRTDKNPELRFAHPAKPSKSLHWGIVHKARGKVIGEAWVYLIESDRMAKIAVRLGAAWHGQGLGSEAVRAIVRFCFENTELRRLWTDVDVRNAASARMLEKCGFTEEGLIRQGKLVSVWCDYRIYAILREDFLGSPVYKEEAEYCSQDGQNADCCECGIPIPDSGK